MNLFTKNQAENCQPSWYRIRSGSLYSTDVVKYARLPTIPRRLPSARYLHKIPAGVIKYAQGLTKNSDSGLPGRTPRLPPASYAHTTLLDPSLTENIFWYLKPIVNWCKPYLNTLGFTVGYTLGYPSTLVNHLHLVVSQCRKIQIWGEPYLKKLR